MAKQKAKAARAIARPRRARVRSSQVHERVLYRQRLVQDLLLTGPQNPRMNSTEIAQRLYEGDEDLVLRLKGFKGRLAMLERKQVKGLTDAERGELQNLPMAIGRTELELEATRSFNQETGQPWTHVLISSDIKAIQKMWQDSIIEDQGEVKGRLLTTIREAQAEARKEGQYHALFRFVDAEINLLGLDSASAVVAQQLEMQFNQFWERIEDAFSDRPEILNEIYDAADGQHRKATPAGEVPAGDATPT